MLTSECKRYLIWIRETSWAFEWCIVCYWATYKEGRRIDRSGQRFSGSFFKHAAFIYHNFIMCWRKVGELSQMWNFEYNMFKKIPYIMTDTYLIIYSLENPWEGLQTGKVGKKGWRWCRTTRLKMNWIRSGCILDVSWKSGDSCRAL